MLFAPPPTIARHGTAPLLLTSHTSGRTEAPHTRGAGRPRAHQQQRVPHRPPRHQREQPRAHPGRLQHRHTAPHTCHTTHTRMHTQLDRAFCAAAEYVRRQWPGARDIEFVHAHYTPADVVPRTAALLAAGCGLVVGPYCSAEVEVVGRAFPSIVCTATVPSPLSIILSSLGHTHNMTHWGHCNSRRSCRSRRRASRWRTARCTRRSTASPRPTARRSARSRTCCAT